MGIFSFLFGKKKNKREEDAFDEQEQFLKPVDVTKDKTSVQKNPRVITKADLSAEEKAASAVRVIKSDSAKKSDETSEKSAEKDKNLQKSAPAPKSGEIKQKPIEKAEKTKKQSATALQKQAQNSVKEDEIEEAEAVTMEETEEVTESKPTRNGKFDIRRAKDGRYFFNLYASNRAVIAFSQIYSSSTAAMTGIKSVIANAAKAPIEDTTLKKPAPKSFPKWEIYIDKAGQYRFRLYASNGSCVCHSHGYAAKSSCKGGIESIARFASETASVDKSYLK